MRDTDWLEAARQAYNRRYHAEAVAMVREVVAPATLAELAAVLLFLAMAGVWVMLGSGA